MKYLYFISIHRIDCRVSNFMIHTKHLWSFILQIITILIIIAWASLLLAQNAPVHNPLSIGLRAEYGFIIPHSKSIAQISNSNPFGFTLDFNKSLISQKSWEKCYCEAQTGFLVSYFNFDNPAILGSAITTSAYFEPLISAKKRLFYGIRGAFGLTYLSKVFDKDHNPDNLFFSMPLSFLVGVSFNTYYRFNSHTLFQLNLNYNHISNGGFKQPNKGMNFPMLSLGVVYSPKSFQVPDRSDFVKPPVNKRFRKQIWVLGSLKTVTSPDSLPSKSSLIYGISANVGKQISHYNLLNLGVEAISDGFAQETIRREGLNKNHHQVGLLVGHELRLGKFTFAQQIGWNIYSPFRTVPSDLYQRYMLAYQINKHIILGITLKTYKHVADIFDIRIGWQW
jgi:hypothetical protein